MKWLNRNLPTWQGRIITGIALVAAVVAGLWPDHPRDADGGRITAVAVAAVAWLFAELAGAGERPAIPSRRPASSDPHLAAAPSVWEEQTQILTWLVSTSAGDQRGE